MTFKLACGDIVPGCAATFESDDRDALLGQVAAHAAHAHGLTDISPEMRDAILGKIFAA